MSLTIQKLKLGDSSAIHICAKMMANLEPWITLRRDYEASIKTLSEPSKEVYLAYAEENIAGFIILNLQGAFAGYIQTVCVFPEYREKGIGSQLMAFAEERIFSEFPNVFICVSSFNPSAQKLYQRLGYEVVGKLRAYVVSEHDEILLRKSISPISEFVKK